MNSYSIKDVPKLLKVKAKAKSKGDLKEVASCCNVLGELFQQQGKYEDAIDEHEEERLICKQLKDTIGIAIAHRKVGEAFNELGKYEVALKHQEKYLSLAKSADNQLEVQRALATLGRTHFCNAEALTTNNKLLYDKALVSSKQAYLKSLELCERLRDAVSERDYMQMNSRLLLNLGLVCDLQCQEVAAINYFKKAIYFADKYSFREDLHRCHYSLALFYQRRKNYSQAKREVELAEKVAFQLKDKSLICDDLSLKAQLFVVMADFESARRYLLKAYRQKTPVAQDHERIEADLRAVIRLCKLQDLCFTVPSQEEEKLLRIYEKMGDLCSSIKAFSTAVEFYEKVLTKAEELGWSSKEMNPILVSLSQTYMDLKDYKKAIVYYKKELEQYSDNPAEECRTLLNIASALEEDGAPYCELEPLYSQAYDLAVAADDPRLQANTLNSLAVLQETNGFTEKAQASMATVNKLCADHDIDLDEESETHPSQTVKCDFFEMEEPIDLQELIDEDSDDEEVGANRGPRKRAKKSIEKLNTKGETALHRACIKQDIALVRMLLQQKHKVNVRDNCGWTPLHEACNYGNVEIVELLIEHGAAVNDRGGKHCEGVTPLHDAACCGHVAVMETLLRSGANPLSQTDAGESAYECLVQWRLRTGGDLDSRSLEQCLSMEKKLADAMKKSSIKVPSVSEVERKQTSTSALIPEEEHRSEATLGGLSDGESDMFEPTMAAVSRKNTATSAQREYAEAMKVIGSSCTARRASAVAPTQTVKRSRPQPALVMEDEDDWLEKDIPFPTRKGSRLSSTCLPTSEKTPVSSSSVRKRSEFKLSLSSRSKASTSSLSSSRNLPLSPDFVDDDNDDFILDDAPPSAKRVKSSPTFLLLSSDDSNERAPSPIVSGTNRTKRPIQLSMDQFTDKLGRSPQRPVHSSPPPASHVHLTSHPVSAPAPNILKLYVRVQDKVLLIPVEHNKSVRWLSEEAARRYYNMTGLNPILSLQTSDGAVLNGDDVVGVILQDGDKIVGDMVKWDLQPLPERYGNLCRQLEIARLGDVDSLLTNAHTSGKLSLELPLGPFLLPVVKALRYQDSLWDLDLSSTKMDDHVFQSLCEALSTLPHLVNLDVHGNLITAAGLSRLAETLRAENITGLKKLQRLNLSFNPLGDGASYQLTACLQHTVALRGLHIECCDLTDRFLDDHIAPALRRRRLEELSIGSNEWSSPSVKLWLELLDLASLKRLSLASVPVERLLSPLVNVILSSSDCRLTDINLSHSNLTDKCVDHLVQVFDLTPHLKRLILKNNPRLSIDAFTVILGRCRSRYVHLEELDLLGCAMTPSAAVVDPDCVEALRSLLKWSKSLRQVSLSFSRQNNDPTWIHSLTDVWLEAHGHEGLAKQPTEHQLILTILSV